MKIESHIPAESLRRLHIAIDNTFVAKDSADAKKHTRARRVSSNKFDSCFSTHVPAESLRRMNITIDDTFTRRTLRMQKNHTHVPTESLRTNSTIVSQPMSPQSLFAQIRQLFLNPCPRRVSSQNTHCNS